MQENERLAGITIKQQDATNVALSPDGSVCVWLKMAKTERERNCVQIYTFQVALVKKFAGAVVRPSWTRMHLQLEVDIRSDGKMMPPTG